MAVRDGSCLRRSAGRVSFARFERPVEQVAKASHIAWERRTDRAFEGQLVVAHLLALKGSSAGLETQIEQVNKGQPQASKTHVSPHRKAMVVTDRAFEGQLVVAHLLALKRI